MSRMMRAAFAAGLFVVLAGIVGPGSSMANITFRQQTGQPCVSCHLPGRENEGIPSLNPTGRAFMDCGETPNCFTPSPDGRTTATQGGIAMFTHKGSHCGHRARYFIIKLGGSTNVGFVLDRGMEVHVAVTRNSTFSAACGGFPGPDSNYQIITLD